MATSPALDAYARRTTSVMTRWSLFLPCRSREGADEPCRCALPTELLRYTLPSRYCDSDKLLNFAWNLFGSIPHGLPRCRHLRLDHTNIEYRFGSAARFSASEW